MLAANRNGLLFGHARLDATARYTHVALNTLRTVMSRSIGSCRRQERRGRRHKSAGAVARPALEVADMFRDRHVEDMLPA